MKGAAIILVAALNFCATASSQAPPPAPAVCRAELMPTDKLQGLYPPGPKRRSETGTVTLALTIDVSSKRPLEVELVKSSGFADLDEAALRIGKYFVVTTDCLNVTVSRAIHFEKEPDPPRVPGSDYWVLGETHIWVEEL